MITALRYISTLQQKEKLDSLKTKNYKLKQMIQTRTVISSYKVRLGCHYSFVNKNRDPKKNPAANLEMKAGQASSFVGHTKLEDFHNFLQTYTDIFTKNAHATKHYRYNNLKKLTENKNLVVISSCCVKKFQDSFHRCFKDKFTHYNDMRPASNQTGRLYPTANTHKFSSLDGITVENLRFLPIISQVGTTYTYNAAKFIADYLKPLCQNECKIIDTQSFPSILKEETLLSSNEEYTSNDE